MNCSRRAGLLRNLWMADPGVSQPDEMAAVVDAVPEPACARYLVLPLFQHFAVDRPSSETPFERMLALAAGARIRGDPFPGAPSVRRGAGADRLPSCCRFAGRISEVPTTWPGWRSHTLSALGHLLPRQGFHRRSFGFERPSQPSGEPGVGVDFGGGPPLPDELAQRGVVVEFGGRGDRSGELIGEDLTVPYGEEFEPGKSLGKGFGERLRIVHGQVAEHSPYGDEGAGPAGIAVGKGQAEVRLVPPAQEDVTALEVFGYLLRVAKEVREGSLNDSHVPNHI